METTLRDNLKLATGAIIAAVFALSLGDALIKQYSASFPIWQIFVVRSGIAVPFLIYFVRIQSCDVTIKPGHRGWVLLRSLILVLMWVFYFAALPQMELAAAAAAYYTLPLFITLFAALLLGESIRPGGWLAVIIGFGGVLLVLQPQAEDFNAFTLLPVAAAVCYAVGMILTRSKCRSEKPTVLSLWLHLTFIAVGLAAFLLLELWQPSATTRSINPFLFDSWQPMWLDQWRVMAILAVAAVVGSICAAIAYQRGPAAVIATFDFAYVAFATVWGLLLFDELPSPAVSAGILAIVFAGLLAIQQRSA